MNFSIIVYILGWVITIESGFMLLPGVIGLIYSEKEAWSYFICAVIGLVTGLVFALIKPKDKKFFAREGFATVGLSWIFMSIFGAIPLCVSGDIPNYIDALFEMSSGFTTTGATILKDVEALSHAGLFWRAFSHWIGGMGVFVFLLAVMPLLGGMNMHLLRAESPGPIVGKLVPKMKDSSQILYLIYFGLTVLQFILLWIMGMTPFEAVCTAFSTAGTGGFGIYNSSIADFSTLIKWNITIFMILFGVNFNVYFLILARKFKGIFKIEEVRWYFLIIFFAIAIIFANIVGSYESVGMAFTDAAFQVASIITTTGFATCDFNLWPSLSKSVIILIMFVGACAGSTGGGLKVSRILILFKAIKQEIILFIHPRSVKTVGMDDKTLDKNVVKSVVVYFSLFIIVLVVSALLVSVDGFDLTTNFSSVLATINNVGPGFNITGPTGGFADFSIFSKIVFIIDMLAGRLELYPILLLIVPQMWKKH